MLIWIFMILQIDFNIPLFDSNLYLEKILDFF